MIQLDGNSNLIEQAYIASMEPGEIFPRIDVFDPDINDVLPSHKAERVLDGSVFQYSRWDFLQFEFKEVQAILPEYSLALPANQGIYELHFERYGLKFYRLRTRRN